MELFNKLFAKTPIKPLNKIINCKHGDCVICGMNLCCTCADTIPCRYKEKYLSENRCDKKLIKFYSAIVMLKNASYTERSSFSKKVVEEYIKVYKPELLFLTQKIADRVGYLEEKEDNLEYDFIRKMQSVSLPKDCEEKIMYIFDAYDNGYLDIRLNWIYNSSLYDRNYEEFKYTVNALSLMNDEEWLKSHLMNIEVVDTDMFFDEYGYIKPAGLEDEDGENEDTIFKIVESWSEDNEKKPK